MTFFKTVFFFKQLWIIATFTSLFLFLLNYHATAPSPAFHRPSSINASVTTTATAANHIVFAIASSAKTFGKRKDYVRVWYTPNTTRAYLFLDRQFSNDTETDPALPPILVHESTDGFPYNNSKGDRSAVAMSRMVKAVTSALRNESEVRWYVFGDDDTVFVVDNVVSTLSTYDHEEWYYVGGISESYEQNAYFSFEMGYGGGGFALSRGLAEVLAGVVDSCIVRYPRLYGSDARIFSCLAELGVGLTHEPGFHQADLWGNLFGLLSSHPQSLLLSLHHLDGVQPLFPNLSRLQALHRLYTAVRADPARISQQTVCYDPSRSLSVSLAWGYAVQIYEENQPLPDLLQPLRTFHPWNREKRQPRFMFKTRRVPSHPCRRPLVLFLDRVESDGGTGGGVWTRYTRQRHLKQCFRNRDLANLRTVNVFSNKLDVRVVKAPRRRQCCDISSSWDESMDIRIRACGRNELTAMFT